MEEVEDRRCRAISVLRCSKRVEEPSPLCEAGVSVHNSCGSEALAELRSSKPTGSVADGLAQCVELGARERTDPFAGMKARGRGVKSHGRRCDVRIRYSDDPEHRSGVRSRTPGYHGRGEIGWPHVTHCHASERDSLDGHVRVSSAARSRSAGSSASICRARCLLGARGAWPSCSPRRRHPDRRL